MATKVRILRLPSTLFSEDFEWDTLCFFSGKLVVLEVSGPASSYGKKGRRPLLNRPVCNRWQPEAGA